MRSKNIFILAVVFSLILSLPFTLSSQEGRGKGRTRGKVMDEAGNPVVGVKIVAQHLESGTTFAGETDKKGSWAVGGMGSGYFRFTASAEGYETTYHEMRVSQFSKKNAPIEFTLKKIQVSSVDVSSIQDEDRLAIFKEGNQLYEQEKYMEAVAKFEELLISYPAVFTLNLNIGNCYQKIGAYDRAITAYTKILDKVKEDKGSYTGDEVAARALAGIGETYIKQDNLDKASEYLRQAIEIFPEDETFAFNIGEIYFDRREIDSAIEYYQLAIKIKKKWAPPYLKMGYAYLNKSDYKGAIDNFKKFLEVAPDDPQASIIEGLIPKLEEMIKK